MNVTTLRAQLAQFLSPNELPDDIAGFLLDQRKRYLSKNVVVVQPKSVQAVQNIVRFCHQNQIHITPQGGNTGLVGGSFATSGVLLNLSKLNRIRSLDLADNAITVDAGCVLQSVQNAASEAGRLFPLSLASEGSCQIGGNIACNAGGLNVLRYGAMRDLVLGLEVVLPDGSLVSHLSPLHKNTTGYDLRHLFIGSEGTLGIITGATLKLFAQPQSVATAWVGVDSIESAVDLLTQIQGQFAERLCSFELISAFALSLSAPFSKLPEPVTAPWHVLIELNDSLPRDDLDEVLAEFLFANGFNNAVLAQSEQERNDLWRLREHISAAQRDLGVSIKHDIAMPIGRVAAFIAACERDLLAAYPAMKIVVFGHLGDGSLHYNTFLPQLDKSAYEQEDAINTIVYQHVLAQNGTIAAEHGIGCLKNHWLPSVRSEAESCLMRAIKRELDPLDLFNRGKLLPHE
ncbi:FAD-binding oxidoreductase [Neisseriaceae bacterium B1]